MTEPHPALGGKRFPDTRPLHLLASPNRVGEKLRATRGDHSQGHRPTEGKRILIRFQTIEFPALCQDAGRQCAQPEELQTPLRIQTPPGTVGRGHQGPRGTLEPGAAADSEHSQALAALPRKPFLKAHSPQLPTHLVPLSVKNVRHDMRQEETRPTSEPASVMTEIWELHAVTLTAVAGKLRALMENWTEGGNRQVNSPGTWTVRASPRGSESQTLTERKAHDVLIGGWVQTKKMGEPEMHQEHPELKSKGRETVEGTEPGWIPRHCRMMMKVWHPRRWEDSGGEAENTEDYLRTTAKNFPR